jgi:hypothetical protein
VVASGQKRCDVCEAAKTVAQAASHKAYKTTYRRETFVCGPKFGENGGCGKTWSKCKCFNDLPGMEGWKDDTLSPKDGTLSPDAVSWSFDPQLHGRYDRVCDHALEWYFDEQVRDARSDAQEQSMRKLQGTFKVRWTTVVCSADERQWEQQVSRVRVRVRNRRCHPPLLLPSVRVTPPSPPSIFHISGFVVHETRPGAQWA